jgi:hypothetical protein
MFMKKLFIACLLATSVSGSFAQSAKSPGPTPEQLAERITRTMQAQLSLSAEEYTGVYNAELAYQKEIKRVQDAGNEPSHGQSMQMKMAKDQKLKAAMTADHYAKYEASK